jgi:hypothetical protein
MMKGEKFPGFERLKKGRKDREAFEWALEHIVKGIVGKRFYDKNIAGGREGIPTKIEKWLTVSDEAWMLLLIENYEDGWMRMSKKGEGAEEEATTTTGGISDITEEGSNISGENQKGKWTRRHVGGSKLGGGKSKERRNGY